MRSVILVLTLLFSPSCLTQLNEHEGHIWMKTGLGYSTKSTYTTIGFNGEYLITRRIGLNYNLEAFIRKDSLIQYHSSVGSLAGPPIILFSLFLKTGNNTFDLGTLGTFAGIAMLVAPDGVCYHIPVGYRVDIAPYVNVLGVDLIRNTHYKFNQFKWANSYGVKSCYWFDNGFTLNAFVESRKTASLPWQFGGGIGIGYAFSPRLNKGNIGE